MQGRSCCLGLASGSALDRPYAPCRRAFSTGFLARLECLVGSTKFVNRQHCFTKTPCRGLAGAPYGLVPFPAPLSQVKTALHATSTPFASLTTLSSSPPFTVAIALGIVAILAAVLKRIYDTPSRTYDGNVGNEYDAWAEEGVVQYYWGEHIHLGYYSEEERAHGYLKKDFKQAKYDFIDEMLRWTGVVAPKRILDVGCGFGGTSRYLAQKFPKAEVIGITLSPKQVEQGSALAQERGISNVKFMVMDALSMTFEEGSFDVVWACESGEHMPDKRRYVEQMSRVLAPGGTLAIATWCQREDTPQAPLSQQDKAALQFLYDEWAHPYFISYEEYGRLLQGTGVFDSVITEDWTPQTLPSWRHSIWVGVFDPWYVIFKFNPWLWYKVTREIVTLERFHRAFARGLCTYGMIKGVKKAAGEIAVDGAATQSFVPA